MSALEMTAAPPYQLMPPLSAEEYAALREDIRQNGVLVPVELDEHHNILDGHNRAAICQELGITNYPTKTRWGLSEAQKRQHVRNLNLNRRHLRQEDRRALIAEQLRETPEQSDRKIGLALGVDGKTVGAVRERLESTAEIPQLDRTTGADGKSRPASRPPVSTFKPDVDPDPDNWAPQLRTDEPPLQVVDGRHPASPITDAAVEAVVGEIAERLTAGVTNLLETDEVVILDEDEDETPEERAARLAPLEKKIEEAEAKRRTGEKDFQRSQAIAGAIRDLTEVTWTAEQFVRLSPPATVDATVSRIPKVRALIDAIEGVAR